MQPKHDKPPRRWLIRNLNVLRWLYPGLGVKRWLGVVLLGVTMLGVGLAFILLEIYRSASAPWWTTILSTIALQSLARPLRALIFGGLGIGLVLYGIWGINRSLLAPYTRNVGNVVEALATYRRRGRGPRIVAIGGGHGLANLLRGLKRYSHNITAVVTVADDGGSSGRIRQSMGILPPGDIRNCLAALSNDEALLTQLFQYRFPDSAEGLTGHSFGNLFISALAEITGSFEEAVAESGRVLSVFGRVLPATLHDVRLSADIALPHLTGEVRVEGESRIPEAAGKVRRLWLEPSEPPAYPEVIRAVLSADLIVIGPGSLYTSVLPNLLVPNLVKAVRASRAIKIYVCNVANQPGETEGYTCLDYIDALRTHTGADIFDLVLCNNNTGATDMNIEWVLPTPELQEQYLVHCADLVDEINPWQHAPDKLADTLIELLEEKGGALLE